MQKQGVHKIIHLFMALVTSNNTGESVNIY